MYPTPSDPKSPSGVRRKAVVDAHPREGLSDLHIAGGRARCAHPERQGAALAIESQQILRPSAARRLKAAPALTTPIRPTSRSAPSPVVVGIDFGACFGGQVRGDALSDVARGVRLAIVEIRDAVVAAFDPRADRELGEARLQQLLRDVERLRNDALLAEGVAHDEVQFAGAGHRRNVGDAERAGRNILAADADVVDQQFGRARDGREAADRHQRVGDEARLERVVGTELHATETDGLAPPAGGGDRIADQQRPQPADVVPSPVRVQEDGLVAGGVGGVARVDQRRVDPMP